MTDRIAKHAPWVRYNPRTDTYDTKDGTQVPAMIVDEVQCLADVMRIAAIREQQRADRTLSDSSPRKD